MRTFKVFEHPSQSTRAVKDGWSWPGFFFTWIWALVKRLFPLGLGILVVYFAIGYFSAENAAVSLVGLGVSIWLGLKGNEYREKDLNRLGYTHVANVQAKSPDRAIVAYFDEVKKAGSTGDVAFLTE